MAEKFAVLIKYKYLEYIENARFSDAEAWVFMKGVIEYDLTGAEPEYENPVMTGLFAVVKGDLDKNRKSYESVVEKRSRAGKKGMAKRWANKSENITNITNDNKNNKDNKCYKNITKITGSGSGSDLANEFEFDPSVNLKSSGGELADRPPQLLEYIKTESQNCGFFIDAKVAKKFQNCGLDTAWYIAPHSFLEYCALTVKKKYPDKQIEELKPLFISAVLEWEERRGLYPTWRDEQDKKAAKEKIKAMVEDARQNKPTTCQCGGELEHNKDGSIKCKKCNGNYVLNEKTAGYDYFPEGASLTDSFKIHMKNRKKEI